MGRYLIDQFKQRLEGLNKVIDVRGKGLMIGIELDTECPELVAKASEKGLLINVAAGNTIRLLPPLIINKEQADQIIDIVTQLVNEL
jgi:acetylornithine aminotransferase